MSNTQTSLSPPNENLAVLFTGGGPEPGIVSYTVGFQTLVK